MAPVLFIACVMGPQESTLVDDLQVVAVLAEPPEAGPGESIALETVIADPTEEGYDLWQWTCLGESCSNVEDTLFIPPTVPASEEPIPVFHWTLACRPGLCEDIEPTLDAPALLEDLPMEGVSLGLRWLGISTRERVNPTVDCTAEGVCQVDGDFSEFSAVYPYSDVPGWETPLIELVPGDTEVELSWVGEENGTAWVGIVDGQGGVGLWTGDI